MALDLDALVPRRYRLLALTAAAAVLAAVAVVEWTRPDPGPTREFFRTPTPHEAEVLDIRGGSLEETELGSAWLREAGRALQEPLPVETAHAEAGRFVPSGADALGYRIRLVRGERLEVELGGTAIRRGDVAVDLFREVPEGEGHPVRLRSPEPGSSGLRHEPEEDATLLVRVQPLLFAGGRYEIRIRKVSALAFPVAGRDQGAILSVFGAPREAGRRSHHGVDIFAPRGTPVVAAASGTVRRANETPIGGRVVWLRDRDRSQSLYYAHLDSQLVRTGDRVSVGDTVGLVGNSGNARTTPPHLHFGIYRRGEGPVDPLPWIRVLGAAPELPAGEPAVVGSWTTSGDEGLRLRARPSLRAPVVTRLERGHPLRVVGVTGSWYRVRLRDGRSGFLAEWVDPLRAEAATEE